MAESKGPGILSFEATVTTAGTAVVLHTEQFVSAVAIRPKRDNGGIIYIGSSDVDKDSPPNDGLRPGQHLEFESQRDHKLNLADYWIDSDTNGDGVDCWALP